MFTDRMYLNPNTDEESEEEFLKRQLEIDAVDAGAYDLEDYEARKQRGELDSEDEK